MASYTGRGDHAPEVVVHPRVARRHPELHPADVVHAWHTRIVEGHDSDDPDRWAALGFDRAGRPMELVAHKAPHRTIVFHALRPPTGKFLAQLGLG